MHEISNLSILDLECPYMGLKMTAIIDLYGVHDVKKAPESLLFELFVELNDKLHTITYFYPQIQRLKSFEPA